MKKHIKAIQKEFQERFGVTANITIAVHDCREKERATQMADQLRDEFNDIPIRGTFDGVQWVKLESTNTELNIFY